jgi:hypothetical protein
VANPTGVDERWKREAVTTACSGSAAAMNRSGAASLSGNPTNGGVVAILADGGLPPYQPN